MSEGGKHYLVIISTDSRFVFNKWLSSVEPKIMDPVKYNKTQRPVFLVGKLLGLAPFSISSENGAYKSVRVSIPWLIYSLLLYSGYMFSFISCVVLDVSWKVPLERNYPFISVIGHLLHIVLGFIVFNVCFILNFARAPALSKVGKAIIIIDAELTKLAHPVTADLLDYRKSIRNKWIFFSLCLAFFVFMSIFDFFVFRDLYGKYIFMMSINYILPYFSACFMQMQFMNTTMVALERFRILNMFLEHIANVNEIYTKQANLPTAFIDNVLKQDPKKEKKSFLDSCQFSPELHLKLHDIFRVHDRLCDVTEDINDVFSTQTVVTITSVFVLLLFGFFFETKVIFWAWGGATKLTLISSSYLLWGIISTFVIYILLNLCTSTRDAANRSALITHRILQMKPAFMLNDEAYYNKMKSFTLQILHRKSILHFNGLGLFRLDYTFIFSAVSAATSYLIVLLQFDMSNELQAFSSNKFY